MWSWNTYKNYEAIMCHKRRVAKCVQRKTGRKYNSTNFSSSALCGDSMNVIVNALMDNYVIHCDMFCIYWRSIYLSRHLRNRWHSGLGGPLLYFVLCTKYVPFWIRIPSSWLLMPGHFPHVLLHYTLYGATLEEYPEASAAVECSCASNCGCPRMAHWTCLLRELHWVPVCFEI